MPIAFGLAPSADPCRGGDLVGGCGGLQAGDILRRDERLLADHVGGSDLGPAEELHALLRQRIVHRLGHVVVERAVLFGGVLEIERQAEQRDFRRQQRDGAVREAAHVDAAARDLLRRVLLVAELGGNELVDLEPALAFFLDVLGEALELHHPGCLRRRAGGVAQFEGLLVLREDICRARNGERRSCDSQAGQLAKHLHIGLPKIRLFVKRSSLPGHLCAGCSGQL